MNQSLTYKKLRDYILIVFVYLFFRMNSYFTRGSTIEQFLLIGRVAIIALSFLIIFRVRFIPNKSIIILTVGTSFWFFLTGLQNYSGTIDILTNFLTQMWWASFLIISYLLLIRVRDDERKKIINIGVIAFYVFSLRYAIWLLSGNRYWSSGGINSIYYCVLLLPLCYLVDKKTVKYSMIFIAALLTIISGKRTALISIILCGFLPPILEKDDKRGKKKTGTMVLLMIVCIMLVYVSEYLSKSINITIIERMQSLQEDGGSGRTTTYALVWEAFKSSNIVKQVIGHGYNAVYLDKISISSAHNDFLEVLYDYGAIGLLFYVLLLFDFIFEAVKLRKAQCESFAAVTASILIYITLSCVSHLIIYPTYNVFLLFIISVGFSEYEKNQRNSVGGEVTK